MKKIKYYRNEVESKAKFHITLGHQTVLGTCIFYTPVAAAVITPVLLTTSGRKRARDTAKRRPRASRIPRAASTSRRSPTSPSTTY